MNSGKNATLVGFGLGIFATIWEIICTSGHLCISGGPSIVLSIDNYVERVAKHCPPLSVLSVSVMNFLGQSFGHSGTFHICSAQIAPLGVVLLRRFKV